MDVVGLVKAMLKPRRRPGMVETRRPDSFPSAAQKAKTYLAYSAPPALHLGCGDKAFVGWLNIDIGGKADIVCDLTRPLSFLPSESFEHVLEHFDRPQGGRILNEVYRILKPGGVVRLALPDLDRVISEYLDFQPHKYCEIHEAFSPAYGETFRSKGEFIDICFRAWGHTYLYNEEDLTTLLTKNSFRSANRKKYHESEYAIFRGIETRPPDQSALILEAKK